MRWTGENKESSPVSGIREVVEVVGLLLQLLPCHPMPRSMTCPMNFLSCLRNILSGSTLNTTLKSFSLINFLISCTPNPLQCGGSGGCKGSVEPLAYTYASLFGVVMEEDYPYTAETGDCLCDDNGMGDSSPQ